MTRNWWLAGGLVGLALCAIPVAGVLAQAGKAGLARPGEEKGDDPKPLKGTWVVKAETFDGDEIPADVAGKCSFVFDGGTVRMRGGLVKAGDRYLPVAGEHKYTVKLGTADKVKTID